MNLGGSTGLAFFRPQNATFEAADILVQANLIQGSQAPIAYVGSTRVKVCNNTIIKPTKWVIRILQETVDPTRFIPCGNNEFCNNIVVIDQAVSTEVNIGPNVNESSFLFSHNMWQKIGTTNWRGPSTLPVIDPNQIVADPLFVANSFLLTSASPAIGKGKWYVELSKDYFDRTYLNPPTIGYHEPRSSTGIKFSGTDELNDVQLMILKDQLFIHNISSASLYLNTIHNVAGQLVLNLSNKELQAIASLILDLPKDEGIYVLTMFYQGRLMSIKFFK